MHVCENVRYDKTLSDIVIFQAKKKAEKTKQIKNRSKKSGYLISISDNWHLLKRINTFSSLFQNF